MRFFLEQCLCSVQKAIEKTDAEILVVDNASTDESIAYLQPLFPSVRFITNTTNEGFAKANNKALKIATGKYVLFLNPDTIVSENSFTDCVSFFEKNENAGSVGIKMIDGSGRFLPESKRSFPTLFSSFFKMSGLAFLFNQSGFFNKYALGNLNENNIHAVDVTAGAFMMVKKELLQSLNGFDESFFMYGEDIDLSYRIRQKGFQNYYLGNNTIIHFKGESSRKQSVQYIQSFYGAMIVFVKKHYKKIPSFFFSLLIRFTIFCRIVLHFFLPRRTTQNRYLLTKTIVAGSVEAYKNILQLLEKENLQSVISGRISISKNKSSYLKLLQQLKQQNIREIIFCEGELSYHQIISIIEQLPHHYKYYFFSVNGNSIVSSHSKVSSGQTIPEKNSYLA